MFVLNRRIVSVVIVCVLLFACAIPILAVDTDTCSCGNDPIVYIRGRDDIYKDKNNPAAGLAVAESDSELISAGVDEILPYFADAVFLGKWDEYYDVFVETVAPMFSDFALSKEGTVENDSGIIWTWPEQAGLPDNHRNDSVWMYNFQYDFRVDPYETADKLNDYIEAVKAATGHSKVNIISRCVGSCITAAYLNKYEAPRNYSGINNIVWYDAAVNGVDTCNAVFSGEFVFDPDSVDRFANEFLGSSYILDFLKATLTLFNKTYTLDAALMLSSPLIDKIIDNVMPRILREAHATCPGYWSMVGDKYYEKAKEFIFGGVESEYSGLIDKIDNYHENVQLNIRQALLDMKASGAGVSVIGKYGFQLAPIIAESNEQSNYMVTLKSQTFGSTGAPYGEVFDKKYIEAAKRNGTDKYIAPDKQVDTSTCLFPDSTWCIKNLEHNPFPGCFDPMLYAICRFDGQMTVTSDSRYPQYLLYDIESETFSALTEENTEEVTNVGFFEAIIRFFRTFYNLLRDYFMQREAA